MNEKPISIGTEAGKPADSSGDKPDYYRVLSDMSRKKRQRAEASAEDTTKCIVVEEDSSGRAGNIKEPEMTLDEFYKQLCSVLPPKSRSDRTTFRRVAAWVIRKCKYDGQNEYELCARILDFAKSSQKPPARNPRAVFISVLKKELGYPK